MDPLSSAGKLAPFSSLVGQSFTLVKKNINTLALIAVIPIIFTETAQAIISFVNPGDKHAVAILVISLLFTIIALVFTVIYSIVMVRSIHSISQGESVDVTGVFQNALKDFFPYLLVLISVITVVFGASLVFVVPGVIALFYFIFFFYTYALEGKRGIDALVTSALRIRGNFFDTVTCLFGVFLLSFALFLLILLVMSIVTQVLHLDIMVYDFLVNLFTDMFVIPFTLTSLYFLYQDLVRVQGSVTTEMGNVTSDAQFRKTTNILITISLALVILGSVCFVSMPHLRDSFIERGFTRHVNMYRY